MVDGEKMRVRIPPLATETFPGSALALKKRILVQFKPKRLQPAGTARTDGVRSMAPESPSPPSQN